MALRPFYKISLNKKFTKRFFLYLTVFAVFFIYAFPVLWLITTSFKQEVDALSIPPKWTFIPTLDNYKDALFHYGLKSNFINSIIISISSCLLALFIGIPAAYTLSRFEFPGKKHLLFWILSTRMAPFILAAIPFFTLSRQWGLFDTHFLMITVYLLINLAWVIWMMHSYFNDIPIEIDEAVMIDGCSRFGALIRVILPLARPGIAATFIFSLILTWNEYFFALILTSVRSKTLPAAMTAFLTIHGLLWGPMTAAATLTMAPILVFIFIVQRNLIRGMTMGAIKS